MTDLTETVFVHSPFSDRTAIHGRNLMALSATTLAIAVFPDIDVAGLKIFEMSIGESFWKILVTVLTYYTGRFSMDFWVERSAWSSRWMVYAGEKPTNSSTVTAATAGPLFDQARRENTRFLIFDFLLPYTMAMLAWSCLAVKLILPLHYLFIRIFILS